MPAQFRNQSASSRPPADRWAGRRLPIGIALAGVLAMAAQPNLLAQTWQTVLDYQLVPGLTSEGVCIAADAAGHVFSGGIGFYYYTGTAGNYDGLVLKTDSSEANWYFSDDTNPSRSLAPVYELA